MKLVTNNDVIIIIIESSTNNDIKTVSVNFLTIACTPIRKKSRKTKIDKISVTKKIGEKFLQAGKLNRNIGKIDRKTNSIIENILKNTMLTIGQLI